MASLSEFVPARYYAQFLALMDEFGFDGGRVLRIAGIPRRQIEALDGTLHLSQVEALVDAALAHAQRSDLGFELGRRLKLTSHSVVSYGILSSPNVGYCLRLVARFFTLIMPSFQVRFALDRQSMTISGTPAWAMSQPCLDFHLELIGVAFHCELGDLLGSGAVATEACFSFGEPPHARRYEEFRPLRGHFGWLEQPGFRLVWPTGLASRPLPMADPIALQLAEQRCGELIDRVSRSGKVADWVHMMLRQASGAPPTLGELAQALNLSARTLDRYLKREGTCYRTVANDARRLRACDLLSDEGLSVTRVAFELGYTDASNFARAFRRESGCSPAEWRSRNAAAAHGGTTSTPARRG